MGATLRQRELFPFGLAPAAVNNEGFGTVARRSLIRRDHVSRVDVSSATYCIALSLRVNVSFHGPYDAAPMEIPEGAKTSVDLALLGPDGPSGRFIH